MATADPDLYAEPEKREDIDWNQKPLPSPKVQSKVTTIKNANYRWCRDQDPGYPGEREKSAQHEELSMANAELSGLKLLLHDSIKAHSHQEHQRKKSHKSKKLLLFIILLLSNLLTCMSTGSITYFMCQDQNKPSADSQSEIGPTQPGHGIIPTLNLGSGSLETSGIGKQMTGGGSGGGSGGGEYEITAISGRADNAQQRDRLTNTTKPSSLLLGSIWEN